MKRYDFNPDSKFFELKIVQDIFWATLFVAVVSALVIAAYSKPTPNFSHEGFNQALVIFRFPIGVLALLIPLIAVMAANHRSVQTKAQISLTKTQIENTETQIRITTENNAFSNYFKHSDEFDKHIKSRSPKSGVISDNSRHLHRKLFPEAKLGEFHISKKTFEDIDSDVESILSASEAISSREDGSKGPKYLYSLLEGLLKKYSLNNYNVQAEITDALGHHDEQKQLANTAKNFARSLITALEFDEKATPSELLMALAEFNYTPPSLGLVNRKDGVQHTSLKEGVNQIIRKREAEKRMAQAYNQKLNEEKIENNK